ncbi:hypothetical protein D3C86_1825850 [compost metagenome]
MIPTAGGRAGRPITESPKTTPEAATDVSRKPVQSILAVPIGGTSGRYLPVR